MRRLLSRNPRLRTGGIISLLGHLLVILALMITMPNWKTDDQKAPDATVEMIFNGKAQTTIKAPAPAPIPAPSREIAPPAPPVTEAPQTRTDRGAAATSAATASAASRRRVSAPRPAPPSNLPPPEPSPIEAPIIPPPPAPPAQAREEPPRLITPPHAAAAGKAPAGAAEPDRATELDPEHGREQLRDGRDAAAPAADGSAEAAAARPPEPAGRRAA